MKTRKSPRRALKVITVTALLLLAVSAGVLLRQYLLLRKIQATLRLPAGAETREPPPTAAATTAPDAPLVSAVSRSADGSLVRARANFSAFKKRVEAHPELLRQWGRVGWKIVGDVPALCVHSVADEAPFLPLGVQGGDCITHIDGESINQPVRNMGIWLSLSARSRLKIDTLRNGKRISYELVRK